MKVKGEGLAFYSPEEAEIAYAEGEVSLMLK
jgi:DNA-directed RNA polymerase subunit beta'